MRCVRGSCVRLTGVPSYWSSSMPRKGALGELIGFSPYRADAHKIIFHGNEEVIVLLEPEEVCYIT